MLGKLSVESAGARGPGNRPGPRRGALPATCASPTGLCRAGRQRTELHCSSLTQQLENHRNRGKRRRDFQFGKNHGMGDLQLFPTAPREGKTLGCAGSSQQRGRPGTLVRPSEYSASKCLSLLSCKVGVKILPAPWCPCKDEGRSGAGPVPGEGRLAIHRQEWQDLPPEPAAHLGWVSPKQEGKGVAIPCPQPWGTGEAGKFATNSKKVPAPTGPRVMKRPAAPHTLGGWGFRDVGGLHLLQGAPLSGRRLKPQ